MILKIELNKESMLLVFSTILILSLFYIIASSLNRETEKSVEASYEYLAKEKKVESFLPENLTAEFAAEGPGRWSANGPAKDKDLINIARKNEISWLKLNQTELTASGFEALIGHPIVFLKMAHQNVDCPSMEAIGKLDELEQIVMSENRVSDEILKCLPTMKSLKILWFRNSDFKEEGMRYLCISQPQLEQLSLNSCKTIDDEAASQIARHENIHWMDLSSTSITNKCMKDIAAMKKLTHLGINKTKITDSGIASLRDSRIQAIMCNDTAISDQSLETFTEMKELRLLDLARCKNITSKALSELAARRPDIEIKGSRPENKQKGHSWLTEDL